MMINSGVSEEEVLNSFENISLQTNKNAPDASKRSQKGVEDLLGQPSGKFDYKVFYSKLPSYNIPINSIIPGSWGDEFEDDEPVSKKDKKIGDTEQPQKEVEEEILPSDNVELLNRKETCMVEI